VTPDSTFRLPAAADADDGGRPDAGVRHRRRRPIERKHAVLLQVTAGSEAPCARLVQVPDFSGCGDWKHTVTGIEEPALTRLVRRRLHFRSGALAGLLAFASSCSDPGAAPPQAALSLQWAASTQSTKTLQCPPGPHWTNAPATANDQSTVNASAATRGFVVNGQNGGRVQCSVIPQGQQYLVSAEIQSGSPDDSGVPGTSPWTQVSLSVAIDGENEAQGSLYVADQTSVRTFSDDTTIIPPKPGCVFSAYPGDAGPGPGLGVGPGHFWGSVQCPHLNDERNRAKQECQITTGYVVLENCTRE
jgi:hypothetical protein